MSKYQIVRGDTAHDLQTKLKTLIAAGWSPSGGMTVGPDGSFYQGLTAPFSGR